MSAGISFIDNCCLAIPKLMFVLQLSLSGTYRGRGSHVFKYIDHHVSVLFNSWVSPISKLWKNRFKYSYFRLIHF